MGQFFNIYLCTLFEEGRLKNWKKKEGDGENTDLRDL